MSAISFRKKVHFVHLSLAFALMLLVICMIEYIRLTRYSDPTPIPTGWNVSILLTHCASFYLCLLGFVYSNESGDRRSRKLALWTFLFNISVFAMRIAFYYVYGDYRPVTYNRV
eukprot:TRINITY_DN5349_c0_g4_i2.p1 TRINITY_DN5349_c0_g4~~TRINITY_DN5349_c0_g4_i2.p1  ORF type:complete len:114 (-),score=16.83 TRINITY_DN5349_c0_g4_i2:37-378(-)